MSQSVDDLTAEMLQDTNRWFLRNETLKAANTILVSQPAAQSSLGQRQPVILGWSALHGSARQPAWQRLAMFSPNRLSRQLRRLLDIGAIKRVTDTYRYYLTKAGRAATAAAQRLKQETIVPAMI